MARHVWTDDDDARLRADIEAVLPLQDSLKTRTSFWAAVCGRLALADVTPAAARSRYDRLSAQARAEAEKAVAVEEARQAAQVPQDGAEVAEPRFEQRTYGWDEVTRKFEEFEQSEAEAHDELLASIDGRLARIEEGLMQLVDAWK
jgi:hypothetical protein